MCILYGSTDLFEIPFPKSSLCNHLVDGKLPDMTLKIALDVQSSMVNFKFMDCMNKELAWSAIVTNEYVKKFYLNNVLAQAKEIEDVQYDIDEGGELAEILASYYIPNKKEIIVIQHNFKPFWRVKYVTRNHYNSKRENNYYEQITNLLARNEIKIPVAYVGLIIHKRLRPTYIAVLTEEYLVAKTYPPFEQEKVDIKVRSNKLGKAVQNPIHPFLRAVSSAISVSLFLLHWVPLSKRFHS